MNVKLHKVTVFVVSPGNGDEDPLEKLIGDCYHNCFSHITETQTVEFDREWSENDPLNKTGIFMDRELLESLIDIRLEKTGDKFN